MEPRSRRHVRATAPGDRRKDKQHAHDESGHPPLRHQPRLKPESDAARVRLPRGRGRPHVHGHALPAAAPDQA